MKRLALLCLIAPALAIVTGSPAEAAFDCSQVYHTTHAYKTFDDPIDGHVQTRYDWSLRIQNQHCVSPTTYFDDIVELRVRGEIIAGGPTCNGDVIAGWSKYTADVGRLGARDPSQVEWNCTSSTSWQFTWPYPANDNLYLGAGDRCVGAHVRWVRPIYPDASDDIPQVCF